MNNHERAGSVIRTEPPPNHKDATQRASRLLIVDDEADLRFLLSIFFGDLGWQVDEASDGFQALEKLKTQTYDLVLLDHRMPGLNGGEVYDNLRARGIVVPVILLSAAKQVEEIATMHGIDMFLGKPFGIDDLLHVINNFAHRR